MTKAELEALVEEVGGEDHISGLTFDNGLTYTFGYGGKIFFHLSDLKTIGGVDYYAPQCNFRSKAIYGGGYDIPAHAYHPLDFLQAISVLDNVEDLKKVDAVSFHDFKG